jgi:glycosyltransferase involved in cell wall biosynthesis
MNLSASSHDQRARSRLLYLGFAFPPGFQALHPGVNPAGHAFETQMLTALRPRLEIRSVGLLPFAVREAPRDADLASGVPHEILLEDRAPEIYFRWRSIRLLKQQYLRWVAAGWEPGLVLVYNLSPVYNHFVRWLRRQPKRPALVLLLLDSSQLGEPMPPLKRLRYRFKPLVVPDEAMIAEFDACIGLGRESERYFAPRGVPFLWMPGACTPERAPRPATETPIAGEPLCFGYFGALAAHAGVMDLVRLFLAEPLPARLEVCGYGKLSAALGRLADGNPRLRFHGLLPAPSDVLRLAQTWDVLVNPRPAVAGASNTFPSKLFEYALCGRAILSTRLSGADTVLGDAGYFFDERDFDRSLAAMLTQLAATPRAELHERGQRIRERITQEYSWQKQASRMASFLAAVNTSSRAGGSFRGS